MVPRPGFEPGSPDGFTLSASLRIRKSGMLGRATLPGRVVDVYNQPIASRHVIRWIVSGGMNIILLKLCIDYKNIVLFLTIVC